MRRYEAPYRLTRSSKKELRYRPGSQIKKLDQVGLRELPKETFPTSKPDRKPDRKPDFSSPLSRGENVHFEFRI